jgi:hypothetical protein
MRAATARVINAIANQPEVYPFVCPDPSFGYIFFDEHAARPEHYVLLHNGQHDDDLTATAAMIFEWSAPGVWEMHTLFRNECRGKAALAQAHEFVAFMYDEMGADMIWGQTPLDNKAARFFNRKLGGKSVGTGTHHAFGPVEFFRCFKHEWTRPQG